MNMNDARCSIASASPDDAFSDTQTQCAMTDSTPPRTPDTAPAEPDSTSTPVAVMDSAGPPGGDFSTTRGAGRFPSHGRRATDGVMPPVVGRPRPNDRMLNVLLKAAEREVRIGLTVTVGGIVVTGTLIGTLAYCRALADQFASSAGGTDMDDLFADSFRDLVDDAAGVARGDRRDPPDAVSYEQSVGFLHLADARYVGASGLLPHGRHGILWRCPVSDVSGWSMGDLTTR